MSDPTTQPAIDWLILTAANRAQGRGYEAQLRARERAGALRACRRWLVIPDARDRRIGSGGSTFAVLYELARRFAKSRPHVNSMADLFANQRILIIHSGGDSRRLPAYSAQGKIFTPLPCDTAEGREADLFDLVLEDLLAVPLPESGRVLIASGDVMLGVARHRPRVDAPGVVGVAFPTDLERGSRHGVFVCDPLGRVTDFLQKPSPQASQQRGATDTEGRVLIDTGLVSLDPATIAQWLIAAGVMWEGSSSAPAIGPGILRELVSGRGSGIDLYHHILRAIPSKVSLTDYLRDVAGDGLGREEERERCTALFEALHGLQFSVSVIPECDFLHIGTSRELLAVVGRDARINRSAGATRINVYNSDVRAVPRGSGPGSIIEGCSVTSRWKLAGDNIIVGVPQDARAGLSLPRGWGLACLPIGRRDWTWILFGDRDDAKTRVDAGGTLGNHALSDLLRRARLSNADVWKANTDHTLWTARLWKTGRVRGVLRDTLWMVRSARPPSRWKSSPRHSIADLLTRVNHARLIAQRGDFQRRDRIARLVSRLNMNPWLSAQSIVSDISSADEMRSALSQLDAQLRSESSALTHARLLRLAAMVRARHPKAARPMGGIRPTDFNAAAFAAVARAVAGQIDLPTRPAEAKTLTDQVVWVTTPVRIDFHGGWSDTPPICHELGGRVVNGAITLNGQYPVQVMARVSEQPRIRISSVDLGASVSLTSAAQACAFSDPHDWAALAKAALVLSGIAPSRPKHPLEAMARAIRRRPRPDDLRGAAQGVGPGHQLRPGRRDPGVSRSHQGPRTVGSLPDRTHQPAGTDDVHRGRLAGPGGRHHTRRQAPAHEPRKEPGSRNPPGAARDRPGKPSCRAHAALLHRVPAPRPRHPAERRCPLSGPRPRDPADHSAPQGGR
jgi:fucokinase